MSLMMCLLGIAGLFIVYSLFFYVVIEIYLRILKVKGQRFSLLAAIEKAAREEEKRNYKVMSASFLVWLVLMLALFPLLKVYIFLTEQLGNSDYQFYVANIFSNCYYLIWSQHLHLRHHKASIGRIYRIFLNHSHFQRITLCKLSAIMLFFISFMSYQ